MFEDTVILSHCPNCHHRIDLTGKQLRRPTPTRCPRCPATFNGRDFDRKITALESQFDGMIERLNLRTR